ncbi:MAG TPA: nickel-dependent hydrogenase large subunit [Candidatus Methylomirabilis sp.]|nr:nickel-dependent hydrogenase large subunit [Candidatus Methylomirabilis sp.]
MPYRIPVGPFHPALEEPYKLSVSCQGETIQGVQIEIGFSFRAIELLAQRRNYIQGLTLVERVCGICSGVHTLTFCMAAEVLAGVRVPPRAQYIRVIVAELERLHSHLLWAGIAADDMGFQSLFMEVFALRERIMDVLELLSGNRVHYAMNCIGGVNRDVRDPEAVLAAVRGVRQVLEQDVVSVLTLDPTVRARTQRVGILGREQAIAYGVVGPTARASGLDMDVRRDQPYAAYGELGVQVMTAEGGDVQARIKVRALEMQESIRLIEEALRRLPSGPTRAEAGIPVLPPGEATARAEAPRGELFYYLASDGSDTPRRVKIRTPTFVNIPAVEAMCLGQHLADLPIIQASVDPCCSCTDR